MDEDAPLLTNASAARAVTRSFLRRRLAHGLLRGPRLGCLLRGGAPRGGRTRLLGRSLVRRLLCGLLWRGLASRCLLRHRLLRRCLLRRCLLRRRLLRRRLLRRRRLGCGLLCGRRHGRRLLGSLLAGRFLRALACTAATLAAAVLLVHGGPGNALGGAFTRAAITFAFLDVLGRRFCFSVYADLSPRGMTILLSLWSGQQAQLGLTRPLAGGGRRQECLGVFRFDDAASLPTRAAFSSAWPPASLAMAFRCAHARLTNSSAALSFDNAFDASTLSTTATASNTADGVPASCPSAACIAPSLSVAPPTLGATSFTSAPAFGCLAQAGNDAGVGAFVEQNADTATLQGRLVASDHTHLGSGRHVPRRGGGGCRVGQGGQGQTIGHAPRQ